MGLDHQACVFFGTFVKLDDSSAATLLDEIIEEHGGEPTPLQNDSIVLFKVGSQPCGEQWIAIAADHQTRWYGRRYDVSEPWFLKEDPHDAGRIAASLARLGIDPESLPRIGWHFAGEVS